MDNTRQRTDETKQRCNIENGYLTVILLGRFGGLEKGRFGFVGETPQRVYLAAAFWDFLGRRTAWMLGRTPPWAMVTPDRSLFNSSSLRMASCK